MKRILLLVSIVYSSSIAAATLTDQLIIKEPQPNPIYYQLLPTIDEKNPDIRFIRSREPKTMALDTAFLAMIADASDPINFIETGTYLGDTVETALKHFPFVHSVELSKELFEKAQKRFVNNKNARLYHGDSIEMLPSIIKKCKDKTVFFLDAHFSMGTTAKGKTNTPIITELEKIKKSSMKDAIIIIDDARMFYEPLINPANTFMEGYPTLNQIVEKILEINATYQCAIVYDTLIAFPAKEKITISPVVRSATISRLYDGSNYLIEDVVLAELCIANAKDKEKEALINLGEHWIEKFSEAVGLSRHYDLWYGLVLMVNEEYGKARAYFLEGKKRGLRDWRIDWYIAMAEAQCFFDIR